MTAVGDAANTGPSDGSMGPVGPGGGERPDGATRFAAAAALRRLGHAIVAHEVGDDVLDRITAEVGGLLAAVEASPQRERAPLDTVQAIFLVPPPDGAHRPKFPDSIVTGKANPMGMAADIGREGDEAVLRARLGPAFEGAPGRAHGGVVAALLDEVMGFVLSIHATAAYTGRLTVTYRAPAPLGVEIEMRARLRSKEGRKLCIDAQARHGTTLIALGEGLFVTVDPERFGSG